MERVELEYRVVVNHEEQYSIWPAYKDIPDGWQDAGKRGARAACLDWIERVWTDMRPRSLRERQSEAPAMAPSTGRDDATEDVGPGLVDRLSGPEEHAVCIARAQHATDVLDQLNRGFVHVLFPDTEGGTELGCELDRERTERHGVDFDAGSGELRVVADLTLDHEALQLVAVIDMATLVGTGRLVRTNGATLL